MAEAIVLRFTGVGEREYRAVNEALGIDMASGEGEWPEGLLVHAAAVPEEGSLVVGEVWSSREAQAAFMQGRLGAALAAGGVTAVPEVTWLSLMAFHVP